MQAVVLERYGLDALELKRVPKPALKANQCLVRVHAASINDWDWEILRGAPINRLMSGLFAPRVKILGCDVAGRVEAVGRDVRAFKPGDEVFGDLCMAGFGAFAEYVAAPERALALKPPGMTFVEAAAIPQAGMLAVQGLIDVGRLRSGQKVLLNGAGGGVGTFALQLAKLHDDVEVTAVDSAAKRDLLRKLGADHVIDYAREDFTKGARRYDLILDVKTRHSPLALARALKPGGIYATVGGTIPRLLQFAALAGSISWTTGKQFKIVILKPNKDLAYLSDLFAQGKLRPIIDGPYKLNDICEAFRRFGKAEHKGKIVVTAEQ